MKVVIHSIREFEGRVTRRDAGHNVTVNVHSSEWEPDGELFDVDGDTAPLTAVFMLATPFF